MRSGESVARNGDQTRDNMPYISCLNTTNKAIVLLTDQRPFDRSRLAKLDGIELESRPLIEATRVRDRNNQILQQVVWTYRRI